MIKKLMLLFLLLHYANFAEAGEITISSDTQDLWLGKDLDILRDSTDNLTLDDLKSGKHESEFFTVPRDIPTFGYFDRNTYWARFKLKNPSDQPVELYIVSRYAPLDALTLFWPQTLDNSSYQSLTLGDQIAFTARPLPYRFPIFPITVPPGTHSYFIKFKTTSSAQFPLSVWTSKSFQNHELKETTYLGLLFGITFAMLLYNLFVYLKFHSRAYGYYIFYIFCYALYVSNYQGLLQQYVFPIEGHSWIFSDFLMISIDLVDFAACTFSLEFLRLKEAAKKFYWLINGLRWVLVFNIVNCLTLKIESSQITVLSSMLMSFILIASGAYCSRNFRPARYYTLAWTFVLAGNITQILAGSGIIAFNAFSSWAQFSGYAVELILLSLALGDRMALINLDRERALKAEGKLQQELILSEKEKFDATQSLLIERESNIRDLDRKVYDRTRDIKSILSSINQGIFTIGKADEKLQVEAEFSKHLAELLVNERLAGADPLAAIFSQTNLSSDILDQIRNVLLNCINEDFLNYEMNNGLLVKEMILHRKNSPDSIIEIDWVPILDGATKVDKILVTIRDVSQIRNLREQAKTSEHELLMTGELTTKQGKKFPRLRASAYEGLEKCRLILNELITTGQKLNTEKKSKIMNFLHTMKGESRVYGFMTLSKCIHDIESAIASQEEMELSTIAQGMDNIHDFIGQYNLVWVERLGYFDDGEERITIEASMVQRMFQFIERAAKGNNPLSPAEYSNLKRQLDFALGTDLESVVYDQIQDLQNLAQELGKSTPQIQFQGRSRTIPRAYQAHLSQAFGHLLRNSIDHGIESKSNRLRQGKKASGLIRFDQNWNNGVLTIKYSDDGCGLDLVGILDRAKRKGLVGKDQNQLAPETIADFIFTAGLTTRDSASSISGRGIGMDAVKELVNSIHGSIKINLEQALDAQAKHFAFNFEISIPISEENDSTESAA